MANWGVPDYDTSEGVDYEGLHRRIRKEDPDALLAWPIREYPVRPGYDRDMIQVHCVKDKRWQEVRLSMKGKPTHEKLGILKAWWDKELRGVTFTPGVKPQKLMIVEIQVGNYLGALRRGGQLDNQNRVRKYL